jgi:ABC-type sugar transport system ATPase subunit
VYQDLALVDQLSVYHNLFLHREPVLKPIPLLRNREMRRRSRAALDDIGINIPRLDVPVARLSGGQRQAIAVARTISGDADIILLDEPLAAMGAKEGAQILDLIARLKEEGRVSIIMILHNYVHVFAAADRVSLLQDGEIVLNKPTSETSVDELNEIVVEQYRRARLAERGLEREEQAIGRGDIDQQAQPPADSAEQAQPRPERPEQTQPPGTSS